MTAATNRWPERAGGFTLLEVLVALAILSVAVVASIQGFAQGLRLLKLAGDHQHAILLADQKAREVVAPQEGREEGQDERGGTTFAWETTTTPIEAPDLVPAGGGPALWRVYQVGVRVRWSERRQVEVATLRMVPVSEDGTPLMGSSASSLTGRIGPAPPGTTVPPGTSSTRMPAIPALGSAPAPRR